ncbi:MAG: hypothetical protein AAF664_25795 [Planctomycetota bacterium]
MTALIMDTSSDPPAERHRSTFKLPQSKSTEYMRPTLVLISLTLFAARANAAIVFSAAGDDLSIAFTAPLVFTVNAKDNFNEYGIVIEDVFSAPQTSNMGISTGDAEMSVDSVSSTSLGGFAGTINFLSGVSDPNDFSLAWRFSSAQRLEIGDTVQISTGNRTVPGFIANGGSIPRIPAPSVSVVLFGNQAAPLSDPIQTQVSTVPEPSPIMLLLAVSLCACVSRRRCDQLNSNHLMHPNRRIGRFDNGRLFGATG